MNSLEKDYFSIKLKEIKELAEKGKVQASENIDRSWMWLQFNYIEQKIKRLEDVI